MKAFRWIMCYPAAYAASLVMMAVSKMFFSHSYYGGGFFRSVVGISPTVLSAAIPTIAMAVIGTLVAPSKGRVTVFVFFGISLLCSCGHFSAFTYQEVGAMTFWCATEVGVVLGGLAALVICLWLQNWRTRRPNKAAQTIPGSSAPLHV